MDSDNRAVHSSQMMNGFIVVTVDSCAVTTLTDICPLPDKQVLGVLRNEGEYKFRFSLIGVIVTIVTFVGSHGM